MKKVQNGLEKTKKTGKNNKETKKIENQKKKKPLVIIQGYYNYKQVRPEGTLHVIADVRKNRYFLIDEDSNVLATRIINGIEEAAYKNGTSQSLIEKRRNQLIKEYKFVNEKNVKNVDTITYKLLKDFDENASTKYAEKYLKMVTINPNRRESESDEKYKTKVINSKKKALREMNMDFTYNTKGILFLKGAKLKDKIQYMKMVSKQQKIFGAKVNSNFLGLFRNKNKMLDSGKEDYVQQRKN